MNWEPPKDAAVWIVCAACRHGDFIAAGPRHFDGVMRVQVEEYIKSRDLGPDVWGDFEQGFIDQYGRFYDREAAMEIVKSNGQRFDLEGNGGIDQCLYSEGLY